MRALLVAVLASGLLLGCTEVEIRACGEACSRSYRPMLKYSDADGCVCGEPIKVVPQ